MLVISAVNGLHNFHANITRHRPPLNKWTNVQISQATIQSHHHYTLIQSMVEGQVDSTNSVIVLKTVWLKMASSDPGAFPRSVLVEDLDRWGGSFFGQEPVGNRVQRCEGKKYSFSRFILKCIKKCFTFFIEKGFCIWPLALGAAWVDQKPDNPNKRFKGNCEQKALGSSWQNFANSETHFRVECLADYDRRAEQKD